jgi:hypothetical protein
MTWTDTTRTQHNRDDLRYPSDLRDEEWAVIAPFFPPPRHGGRPRTTDLREVVNTPWRQCKNYHIRYVGKFRQDSCSACSLFCGTLQSRSP